MQLGMIGLGRMGANMVRRLIGGGHAAVVFDHLPAAVQALVEVGAAGAESLAELVGKLARPRTVWLMVPAAGVDATIAELLPLLEAGDTLIDGGNSHYVDDIRRAKELAARQLHYVDVGTSGGVWGLARGYCMMIGGEAEVVRRLDPIFVTLAPGIGDIARTPGRETMAESAADRAAASTAEHGYLHCGASGAGHFVKMVHNGIEYGMMAAYAEGFNLLRHAGAGLREGPGAPDSPERYQYDFDLGAVAELWRRGSVVTSWLLDLTAISLAEDPQLKGFQGRVSDSGEGRWTLKAAIDTAVPVPVLSAALYSRFESRGEAEFANRLLGAMRFQFGGHRETGKS